VRPDWLHPFKDFDAAGATVDSKLVDDQALHERFVRLLTLYERNLRRYVISVMGGREDVDDVLQETAVALWQKFHEYKPDQPFVNWACRFAYYEVLKQRRKRRAVLSFSDETVEALASARAAHDDQPAQQQRLAHEHALQGCLSHLPPADRELVSLRYAKSTTVAELARDAGLSVKALYRALARARRLLAECVQRKLACEGLA